MNLNDLNDISEGDRRGGGSYRLGTVTAFDAARCRVRVRLDDGVETAWLPWAALSAGLLKIWNPPALGEQIQVQSPSGDLHNAVACPSVFCEANPAPSHNPEHTLLAWADGGYIRYERDTHRMYLGAQCGVRIDGDLIVSGDVMTSSVSLNSHVHGGVQPGGGLTGMGIGAGILPCE